MRRSPGGIYDFKETFLKCFLIIWATVCLKKCDNIKLTIPKGEFKWPEQQKYDVTHLNMIKSEKKGVLNTTNSYNYFCILSFKENTWI